MVNANRLAYEVTAREWEEFVSLRSSGLHVRHRAVIRLLQVRTC
jgi:hypothetical protein